MLRITLTTVLAASTLAFFLAGCSTDEVRDAARKTAPPISPSSNPSAYTVSVGNTASLLIAGAPSSGSGQAGLSGVIGVNAEGCITIGSLIAVAPFGSRLDGDTLTIPNSHVSMIGDQVSLFGTRFTLADIDVPDAKLAECVPSDDLSARFARIGLIP